MRLRGLACSTIVAVALLPAGEAGAAKTNEQRCNENIGRSVGRLLKNHMKDLNGCRSSGRYDECFRSGRTEVAQDALQRAVGDDSSPCAAAVDDDGVPIESFGPADPGPNVARCPSGFVVTTPHLLAACLETLQSNLFAFIGAEIGLRFDTEADANEKHCIKQVTRATTGAVRNGTREVTRCARGGVKPFDCPADADPRSKLGRSLDRISRAVASCKDASGAPGLSGASAGMCFGNATTPADLEACAQRVAKCAACLDANSLYGQTQDCVAFSGLLGCRDTRAGSGDLFVVNATEATVSYHDDQGAPKFGTLAASSFATGNGPAAIAVSEATQMVYVANTDDDAVTVFDAGRGGYAAGSLGASTLATQAHPAALAVHEEARLLYVVNRDSDTITYIRSNTGEYVDGTLAGSSFATGSGPSAVAVDESNDIVYVANQDDDTVTYFDALTGAYLFGTLAASSFAVGSEPSAVLADIALYGVPGVAIYVANRADDTLTILDASTGAPRYGTLAESTMPAGDGPEDIVRCRSKPGNGATLDIYVANGGDASVTVATNGGSYVYGGRLESTFTIGGGAGGAAACREDGGIWLPQSGAATVAAVERPPTVPRDLLLPGGRDLRFFTVSPASNRAYGVSLQFNYVLAWDATTGAYAFGTFANSNFPTGNSPHRVAANPAADRLYVGAGGGMTFLLESTGAPAFGTLEDSNIALPGEDWDIDVDPATNRVFHATGSSVIALDATTGAFANGTLANSTTTIADRPTKLEVNSTDSIVYVSRRDGDAVTYLSSVDGSFLYGTEAASTFSIGGSPGGMAVDEAGQILYAGNSTDSTFVRLDAVTGAYVGGSLAAASTPVFPNSGVAAFNPTNGMLYLGDISISANLVTRFDTVAGGYADGTRDASTTRAQAQMSVVGVNPSSDRMFLAVDNSTTTPRDDDLLVLDATTGALIGADPPAVETVSAGAGPVAVATMP